jgi:hypothetical protein
MPTPFQAPWLLLALFSTISLFSAAAPKDPPPKDNPASFKIVVKVKVQDHIVDADVLFHGDHVLTITDEEPEAVFNLKEMWWHHLESNRRMTLDESRTWHAQSHKRTRDSLPKAPEEVRLFLQALMEPNFKIEEKEGALVMSNNFLHYTMKPLVKLPEPFAPKVAAYNLLNAYETAIIDAKVPPDAALAIAAELSRRKVYPTRTLATIKTPAQPVKLDVTMQLQDLSAEELELLTTTVTKLKQ